MASVSPLSSTQRTVKPIEQVKEIMLQPVNPVSARCSAPSAPSARESASVALRNDPSRVCARLLSNDAVALKDVEGVGTRDSAVPIPEAKNSELR